MTGTDLEDRREGITTVDSGNDRDESVTRLLRGCRSGMGLFGAIGFFEVDSIDDGNFQRSGAIWGGFGNYYDRVVKVRSD